MNQILSSTHPISYITLTLFLALIPLILGTTTSYLKISIALGVLKNGFGAQQVPSGMVIMVLSLVLSLFIMQPTLEKVIEKSTALPKLLNSQNVNTEIITTLAASFAPWRDFLVAHSGVRELQVLQEISRQKQNIDELRSDQPNLDDFSLRILIPAFVLTELKEGLMMGFVLLLPFLVIDLIVANILAGLGLYMMSPTIISLPLKLLLFVSVDGWLVISKGFITSYAVSV